MPLGTGHRHIDQTILLGLGFWGLGVSDRGQALLHSGNVDHIPFQTFGLVERGDLDSVVANRCDFSTASFERIDEPLQ